MMDVCGPVYCPFCKPEGWQTRLECTDSNYSGCGVDMANCVKCGRGFTVSFKVDRVEYTPDWNAEGVK